MKPEPLYICSGCNKKVGQVYQAGFGKPKLCKTCYFKN